MDKAFRNCLNAEKNRLFISETMVKYIDVLLRRPTRRGSNPIILETGSNDTEISNEALENIVDLLVYVEDKDIFQRWYWRMLARRLVSSTFIGIHTEYEMINRLKVELKYFIAGYYGARFYQ